MKKSMNERAQLFYDEMQKSISKISAKHGYKVPQFNAFSFDNAIFFNLTVFNGNPEEQYRKWFMDFSDKIGLDKNLLNKKLFNSEKTKMLTIIGFDPDGGDNCIRVKDDKGVSFNMHPAAIKKLISL